MGVRALRWGIGATLVALLALIAYVLAQAYPSTEAVRLRNALLIAPADARVGEWTPDNAPSTFMTETMRIPASIAEAAKRAIPDPSVSDLDKARALASHLMTHVKDKGPIQGTDVEATYRSIIDEGRGYCADIVDVYVALSLAAGLPVRSWAFSFDGFGGYGHIVVEIFDRNAREWVMLDIYNNVMPVIGAVGGTLSVRSFLHGFREHEGDVRFIPIGPGRVAHSIDEKLRAYYRKGIDQWYLWEGNNVISRGRANVVVASLGEVSQAGAELAAIATGHFPRIVPLPTPTNAMHIERMSALRERLLFVAALGSLLALLLIVLVAALLKKRRVERARAVSRWSPVR